MAGMERAGKKRERERERKKRERERGRCGGDSLKTEKKNQTDLGVCVSVCKRR
jgi:hypothetical protein